MASSATEYEEAVASPSSFLRPFLHDGGYACYDNAACDVDDDDDDSSPLDSLQSGGDGYEGDGDSDEYARDEEEEEEEEGEEYGDEYGGDFSVEELHEFMLQQQQQSMLDYAYSLRRYSLLETIREETSDELRGDEQSDSCSGVWCWGDDFTDGAESVIYVEEAPDDGSDANTEAESSDSNGSATSVELAPPPSLGPRRLQSPGGHLDDPSEREGSWLDAEAEPDTGLTNGKDEVHQAPEDPGSSAGGTASPAAQSGAPPQATAPADLKSADSAAVLSYLKSVLANDGDAACRALLQRHLDNDGDATCRAHLQRHLDKRPDSDLLLLFDSEEAPEAGTASPPEFPSWSDAIDAYLMSLAVDQETRADGVGSDATLESCPGSAIPPRELRSATVPHRPESPPSCSRDGLPADFGVVEALERTAGDGAEAASPCHEPEVPGDQKPLLRLSGVKSAPDLLLEAVGSSAALGYNGDAKTQSVPCMCPEDDGGATFTASFDLSRCQLDRGLFSRSLDSQFSRSFSSGCSSEEEEDGDSSATTSDEEERRSGSLSCFPRFTPPGALRSFRSFDTLHLAGHGEGGAGGAPIRRSSGSWMDGIEECSEREEKVRPSSDNLSEDSGYCDAGLRPRSKMAPLPASEEKMTVLEECPKMTLAGEDGIQTDGFGSAQTDQLPGTMGEAVLTDCEADAGIRTKMAPVIADIFSVQTDSPKTGIFGGAQTDRLTSKMGHDVISDCEAEAGNETKMAPIIADIFSVQTNSPKTGIFDSAQTDQLTSKMGDDVISDCEAEAGTGNKMAPITADIFSVQTNSSKTGIFDHVQTDHSTSKMGNDVISDCEAEAGTGTKMAPIIADIFSVQTNSPKTGIFDSAQTDHLSSKMGDDVISDCEAEAGIRSNMAPMKADIFSVQTDPLIPKSNRGMGPDTIFELDDAMLKCEDWAETMDKTSSDVFRSQTDQEQKSLNAILEIEKGQEKSVKMPDLLLDDTDQLSEDDHARSTKMDIFGVRTSPLISGKRCTGLGDAIFEVDDAISDSENEVHPDLDAILEVDSDQEKSKMADILVDTTHQLPESDARLRRLLLSDSERRHRGRSLFGHSDAIGGTSVCAINEVALRAHEGGLSSQSADQQEWEKLDILGQNFMENPLEALQAEVECPPSGDSEHQQDQETCEISAPSGNSMNFMENPLEALQAEDDTCTPSGDSEHQQICEMSAPIGNSMKFMENPLETLQADDTCTPSGDSEHQQICEMSAPSGNSMNYMENPLEALQAEEACPPSGDSEHQQNQQDQQMSAPSGNSMNFMENPLEALQAEDDTSTPSGDSKNQQICKTSWNFMENPLEALQAEAACPPSGDSEHQQHQQTCASSGKSTNQPEWDERGRGPQCQSLDDAGAPSGMGGWRNAAPHGSHQEGLVAMACLDRGGTPSPSTPSGKAAGSVGWNAADGSPAHIPSEPEVHSELIPGEADVTQVSPRPLEASPTCGAGVAPTPILKQKHRNSTSADEGSDPTLSIVSDDRAMDNVDDSTIVGGARSTCSGTPGSDPQKDQQKDPQKVTKIYAIITLVRRTSVLDDSRAIAEKPPRPEPEVAGQDLVTADQDATVGHTDQPEVSTGDTDLDRPVGVDLGGPADPPNSRQAGADSDEGHEGVLALRAINSRALTPAPPPPAERHPAPVAPQPPSREHVEDRPVIRDDPPDPPKRRGIMSRVKSSKIKRHLWWPLKRSRPSVAAVAPPPDQKDMEDWDPDWIGTSIDVEDDQPSPQSHHRGNSQNGHLQRPLADHRTQHRDTQRPLLDRGPHQDPREDRHGDMQRPFVEYPSHQSSQSLENQNGGMQRPLVDRRHQQDTMEDQNTDTQRTLADRDRHRNSQKDQDSDQQRHHHSFQQQKNQNGGTQRPLVDGRHQQDTMEDQNIDTQRTLADRDRHRNSQKDQDSDQQRHHHSFQQQKDQNGGTQRPLVDGGHQQDTMEDQNMDMQRSLVDRAHHQNSQDSDQQRHHHSFQQQQAPNSSPQRPLSPAAVIRDPYQGSISPPGSSNKSTTPGKPPLPPSHRHQSTHHQRAQVAPCRAKINKQQQQADPPRTASADSDSDGPHADVHEVLENFRQRALEGRERAARTVLDLSQRIQGIDPPGRDQSERSAAIALGAEDCDGSHGAPNGHDGSVSEGLADGGHHQYDQGSINSSVHGAHGAHGASSWRDSTQSIGYLETDIDTLHSREVIRVSESDATEAAPQSPLFHGAGSAPRHRPFKLKTQSMFNLTADAAAAPPEQQRLLEDNARSMEFLLKDENKLSVAPPENTLRQSQRAPSEHELRVRRSLQKLDLPDWYTSSPISRMGSTEGFILRKDPGQQQSATPRWSDFRSRSSCNVDGGQVRTPSSSKSVVISKRVTTPDLRYVKSSRESLLQSPLSPTPSSKDASSSGYFYYTGGSAMSRWSSSRLSCATTASSRSTSPTGSLRSPFQRQPYLGWRSSERLAREATNCSAASSATSTPTHGGATSYFYRSAAERLSQGPGYYALRYGAYRAPGSDANLASPSQGGSRRGSSASGAAAHSPPEGAANHTGITVNVIEPNGDSGGMLVADLVREIDKLIQRNGHAQEAEEDKMAAEVGKMAAGVGNMAAGVDKMAAGVGNMAAEVEEQGELAQERQKFVWMESSFVGVRPIVKPDSPEVAPPGGEPAARRPASPEKITSQAQVHPPPTALFQTPSLFRQESTDRRLSLNSTTLEEVLDSLLALPSSSQSPSPSGYRPSKWETPEAEPALPARACQEDQEPEVTKQPVEDIAEALEAVPHTTAEADDHSVPSPGAQSGEVGGSSSASDAGSTGSSTAASSSGNSRAEGEDDANGSSGSDLTTATTTVATGSLSASTSSGDSPSGSGNSQSSSLSASTSASGSGKEVIPPPPDFTDQPSARFQHPVPSPPPSLPGQEPSEASLQKPPEDPDEDAPFQKPPDDAPFQEPPEEALFQRPPEPGTAPVTYVDVAITRPFRAVPAPPKRPPPTGRPSKGRAIAPSKTCTSEEALVASVLPSSQTSTSATEFQRPVVSEAAFQRPVAYEEELQPPVASEAEFHSLVASEAGFQHQMAYSEGKFQRLVASEEKFQHPMTSEADFQRAMTSEAEFQRSMTYSEEEFQHPATSSEGEFRPLASEGGYQRPVTYSEGKFQRPVTSEAECQRPVAYSKEELQRPVTSEAEFQRPTASSAAQSQHPMTPEEEFQRPAASSAADFQRPAASAADFQRPAASAAEFQRPAAYSEVQSQRPMTPEAEFQRPATHSEAESQRPTPSEAEFQPPASNATDPSQQPRSDSLASEASSASLLVTCTTTDNDGGGTASEAEDDAEDALPEPRRSDSFPPPPTPEQFRELKRLQLQQEQQRSFDSDTALPPDSCNDDSMDLRASSEDAVATGRRSSSSIVLDDTVIVRCSQVQCKRTAELRDARKTFKTCHNCYTYYCSRLCRKEHWGRHRRVCMYGRIRSMCKQAIQGCREDAQALGLLSRVARTGQATQGRGFVKIVFRNTELATRFLRHGWAQLEDGPMYVNWRDLIPQEMGDEVYRAVVDLCQRYEPETKFVLLVAIFITREVPVQSVPHWEREVIAKCAKLPLRDGPEDPGTLVLTGPGHAAARKAREGCMLNVQERLRERGVSLRRHFPDAYARLCSYVDNDDPFPPLTIYPKDGRTGSTFMCVIMPNAGPQLNDWVKPKLK